MSNLPKMTIVGTYKPADSENRVEVFLIRYQKGSKQVAEWVQDDAKSTALPGQPKYANQLDAIDWFYHTYEGFEPEIHVE
jgi:hypothetical protein